MTPEIVLSGQRVRFVDALGRDLFEARLTGEVLQIRTTADDIPGKTHQLVIVPSVSNVVEIRRDNQAEPMPVSRLSEAPLGRCPGWQNHGGHQVQCTLQAGHRGPCQTSPPVTPEAQSYPAPWVACEYKRDLDHKQCQGRNGHTGPHLFFCTKGDGSCGLQEGHQGACENIPF